MSAAPARKRHKPESPPPLDDGVSDWKLFLSFPLHNSDRPRNHRGFVDESFSASEDSLARHHGRLFVRRENGVIYHHGKRYGVSLSFNSHFLHLLSIAQTERCPFVIYCMFSIDKKNMAHVHSYELWLSESMFCDYMQTLGTFPKEIEILGLIRSSMSVCLGHKQSQFLLDSKNDQRSHPGLRNCAHPHQCLQTWNPKYPLLSHQVESFRWMMDLEQRIRAGKAAIVANTTSMAVGSTGWFYNRPFDTLTDCQNPEENVDVPYQGGILADCTGSGKTAVVLALLSATLNQRVSQNSLPPIHRNTFFVTGATLIVVPVNLAHQWTQEMTKFYGSQFERKLKVHPILSQYDFEHTTLTSILAADIVLTTFTFLKSKNYHESVIRQLHSRVIQGGQNVHPSSSYQTKLIRSATRAATKSTPPGFEDSTQPPFESVWWKRIVLDEAHELFLTGPFSKHATLSNLHASFVWGVTGTPEVGTGGMLSEFCNMVHCHPPQWTPDFCHQVVNTCFRRFNSLEFGPIEEHVHWVTLSETETQLLESQRWNHRRRPTQCTQFETVVKMCTYFDLGTSASIDSKNGHVIKLRELKDIVETVKREKSKRIEQCTRTLRQQTNMVDTISLRLDRHASRLRDIQEALSGMNANEDNEFLSLQEEGQSIEKSILSDSRRRKKCHEDMLDTQHELRQINHSMAYFENQIKNYHESKLRCPLCFESDATVILHCGHQFCRPCISRWIQAQNESKESPSCPTCKVAFSETSAHEVLPLDKPDHHAQNVARYGSKITHLIENLHEIIERGEKVLIFVQWCSLMRALKNIFQEQKIRTGCLSNNIQTRASVLHKFDRGESDVLILLLEASSSGLNLVQANHIIFLHALLGSDRNVRMMEEQAIHRVHRTNQFKPVHVHWYISEHTPEEQLFKASRKRIKRKWSACTDKDHQCDYSCEASLLCRRDEDDSDSEVSSPQSDSESDFESEIEPDSSTSEPEW